MRPSDRARGSSLPNWLPRQTSTSWVALWRKLRRLGVLQVTDGLVGLPLDARNREQLEWLACEVAEAGGEASIWIAQPTTSAHERALADVRGSRRPGASRRGGAGVRWVTRDPALTGPRFDALFEHRRRATLLGREPA